MNTERTQFFDQYAPVDDISALADSVREKRAFTPVPVIGVESSDEKPEVSLGRPNKLKKILGGTALGLALAVGAVGFGNLLVNAIEQQITHNQQVNDEYVKQSHEVNPDTVVQLPAPSK